jgi:hypothetical protein
MEIDRQNHLVDHLPIKTLPKAAVQQPVDSQQPTHKNPKKKFLIVIGSMLFIILLMCLGSGLYMYQQDPLTKQIVISPTPMGKNSNAPVQIISPVSAMLIPDLSALVKLLNSQDPHTQKLGVSSLMKVGPSGTPGSLPAGSKLEIIPETWTVLNVDEKNEPYVVWIQAIVTVPGDRVPQHYDLHLIHENERWLLYNTSKR